MNREDIRNLLGGYAAGTLTPAEQKLLFDAALEDQELFDALADEQALKEILDDPESRGYLRAALAEVAPPPEEKKRGFWHLSWQWTAGLATAAAALTIVTVIGLQKTTETTPAPQVAAVKSESSTATPAKTKEPPVEVADARVANQPASKAAPKPAAPAPAVATEARGEESKSTDKKKEAEAPAPQLAAAAPPPQAPPPASAPAQVLDSQRAAGPSASQLYLAQYRQTQMEQQQQQLPGGPARAAFSQMGRVAEKDAQRRDQPEPRAMAKSRAAENTAAGGAAAPADATTPTRSIAQNPGIRYTILRRNSQNQFIATRIDTRFEEGDEIVIAVNKNAGGIVSVLQKQGSGWQALPLASQTLFEARTAPVKLSRGTLDLVVVLSSQQAAAAPPSQTRNQVSETLGNAVYVVTPGQPEGPVAAQLRITVN